MQISTERFITRAARNINHYKQLYGVENRVDELIDILSYYDYNPSVDYWMTMPDMGHLIASSYNLVLYHLSIEQCLTFLPLRSVPVPTPSWNERTIGFVNRNHFVQLFLVPGHQFRLLQISGDGFIILMRIVGRLHTGIG